MSAFGYGSTYAPSWRNESQPAPGTAQAVAPAMSSPNWSPTATNPWSDPGLVDRGDFSGVGGYHNNIYGDYYVRDKWANPLDRLFGAMGGEGPMGNPYGAGPGKQNAIGSQYNLDQYMVPVYGFAGPNRSRPDAETVWGRGAGDKDRGHHGIPEQIVVGHEFDPYLYAQSNQMIDDKKGGMVPGMQVTPRTTKELFDSIGGLQLDQLMRLSSNGGITQKFSDAALDYKNAYANQNYGKKLWGHNAQYGGNALSEAQTMDYLQQSYDKLLTRMNDNYLL